MPLTAVVTARETLGPTLVRLKLRLPDGWTFQAGQFVIIHVPQRAEDAKAPKGFYSIASAPASLPIIELLVEHREDGGYVSGWVSTRELGDALSVEGPLGHFGLAEDAGATRVFIGAGAGLAPLRSMILSGLAQGAGQEHWLFQAGEQLGAEWQALAVTEPRFRYQPMTALELGQLLAALPAAPDRHFYLAGFNRDLEPLKQALLDSGVPAAAIKLEKFG
jgi:ferredoxin-NADP reductase